MKIKTSKTAHASTQLFFFAKGLAPMVTDFSGEKNELIVLYGATKGSATSIYCGLGEAGSVTSAVVRTAAAKAAHKALELKRTDFSLHAPRVPAGQGFWPAALEGALLGSYKFTKYKKDKGAAIASIEIVGEEISPAEAQRVLTLCEGVWFTRDLVNDNAHAIYPESFANQARAIARKGRMKCTVLDEKDLKKKGLGLLSAVGQGSPYPPRLVTIEYRGKPASKDLTAIIGKGITFDSGGQNLKPTGSIETMREDMAGAAAVLGALMVVARHKAKVNVVGVCSLAHNAIGRDAYFPGDVYASFSGKTVEINSTDAEGRLVLADAIEYCKALYNPARIIDLATLTGGILTALGTTVAGLFSTSDELADGLFCAGERTGERLWRFPLYEEFTESLKSDIADLRNISKKRKGWASSITGAAFIREFTGESAWAHLDIAGTAFNEDGASGEIPQGATGFGVRLLVEYLSTL
ncbi:MAG TPA: leucyl aminopeptidase [Chitinivibrionales bacterium]